MADLLALSFLQPWLWAILEGHKPVENRTWKPHRLILGQRIALHASAGWDEDGEDFILHTLMLGDAAPPAKATCPRGAILGTARIVGAVTPNGSRGTVFGPVVDAVADAAARSPWTFGPWAWLLDDVRKLPEPVPCKGALGLWRVPDEVRRQVQLLETMVDVARVPRPADAEQRIRQEVERLQGEDQGHG